MANRDSPDKLAMDAKLARVWTHDHATASPGTLTSYSTTLSPDQIRALEPERQEIARRVFRPLRSA